MEGGSECNKINPPGVNPSHYVVSLPGSAAPFLFSHLSAEIHLEIDRIRDFGDDINDRPHYFGSLGFGNLGEENITGL